MHNTGRHEQFPTRSRAIKLRTQHLAGLFYVVSRGRLASHTDLHNRNPGKNGYWWIQAPEASCLLPHKTNYVPDTAFGHTDIECFERPGQLPAGIPCFRPSVIGLGIISVLMGTRQRR